MPPRPVAYNESEFLRPRAPAMPVWSPAAWRLRPGTRPAGVLSLPQQVHVHSGRYAIGLALRHAGLMPGDRVLVPAYHCLAMIEPLRLDRFEPVYYPVQEDLGIDPARVEPLAVTGAGAKAMLAVHYFGFVQDLSAVRALADRLGLVLIEDCAHTLFGQRDGVPVGSRGDYAIASTLKFLPVADGGLLASARRDLSDLRLPPPPLKAELRAALSLIGTAQEFGRLGLAGRILDRLDRLRSRFRARRAPTGPVSARAPKATGTPEYAVDPTWLSCRGTRLSASLIRHMPTCTLAPRRRAHYNAYLTALTGRTDCRPIFRALPSGVVPQVFPLYVDHCLGVFVELKGQGIPIIRFGEFLAEPVDETLCPVSTDYAEHLLQFPCHQELRDAEVHWIIERLTAALNRVASQP